MIRFFRLFTIALLAAAFLPAVTSCKGSSKSQCIRDNTYKLTKRKGKRSRYGTVYRTKTSPARKDYVIKNKRKR